MSDAPPQDANAEMSVLGSMLLSKTAVDECADIITGTDFYRAAHETIHDAIVSLRNVDEPADAITVADELDKTGDLARVGGSGYLHELIQSVVTPTNATWHAQIIRELSDKRRVSAHLMSGLQGLTEGGSALDVTNAVRTGLDSVVVHDTHDVPHSQAVYDAIASLDRPPGMSTPWPTVTSVLAGWKPGCNYVVGARPGVGKSVFGVSAALDCARRGKTAIVFSLEMSRDELYLRMFSAIGSISMENIQHRRLTRSDEAKMAEAAKHVATLPLVVDDRDSLSVAQMRARVKAEQRNGEVGLVVIDYLALARPPKGGKDRREQVDAISREIKVMAKALQVPVLALAQLNRGSEQRMDKQPMLSDLREAGGQEQDADVVLLLHRDLNDVEKQSDLHVAVAKNRHGPTRGVELLFLGHHSRIEDSQKRWEATA